MYPKNTLPVQLPTTGHLHILKNKGYVYWERVCKWDNKKKQPAGGRILIGRLSDDDKTMMIPNDRYFELFPGQLRNQEKLNEASEELSPPSSFSFTLNYGAFAALKRTAEKTGLMKSLKACFPSLADEIIALAVHSVTSCCSTAQDFPFWAFDNYCGLDRPLTDTEVGQIFKTIGSDQEHIYDFYYTFRENYYSSGIPRSDTLMVAGDSTNQNTYSKNNSLASYGKSKVSEGLPCINMFCLCDLETGIPLYSEVYAGSLLDKVQNLVTVDTLQDLGYQKLYNFEDRGYVTKDNIKKMIDADYEFSVMMPEGLVKVKGELKKNSFIKDNIKYYVEEERVYGICIGEIEILDQHLIGYVYYDPDRAEQEKQSILTKISVLKETVLEKKRLTAKLEAKYGKWFVFTKLEHHKKGERSFTVERRDENIQQELDSAGFFMVCSRFEASVQENIVRVRKRDKVEKVFNRLKEHLGLVKTYVHSKKAYEGKMFVAFTALVLAQGFEWLVKDAKGKKKSDTLNTKLSTLNEYQIHQTHNRNGWLVSYAMTKKQRNLFDCFDISEKELKKQVLSL